MGLLSLPGGLARPRRDTYITLRRRNSKITNCEQSASFVIRNNTLLTQFARVTRAYRKKPDHSAETFPDTAPAAAFFFPKACLTAREHIWEKPVTRRPDILLFFWFLPRPSATKGGVSPQTAPVRRPKPPRFASFSRKRPVLPAAAFPAPHAAEIAVFRPFPARCPGSHVCLPAAIPAWPDAVPAARASLPHTPWASAARLRLPVSACAALRSRVPRHTQRRPDGALPAHSRPPGCAPPRGGSDPCGKPLETAAPSRVKFREIRGPGYRKPCKSRKTAPKDGMKCLSGNISGSNTASGRSEVSP